jgi:pyrophosphatase PpaX
LTTFSIVLFDLDGTLIDTNHLIVTSFQHVFREHLGLTVSPEEIYPYFGEPLVRTMARYAPDRAEELAGYYRAYNMEQHDRLVRQFPGVRDAVMALRAAGVRLGIVTSKKHESARRGLRVCQMEEFFEVVVGVDETERHKPDPEPALLALRRMGAEPGAHVLMVGDSIFDMACGKGAGLKTAAVGWTVNRAALQSAGPDYWVDTPEALLAFVLGPGERNGDAG